MPPFLAYISIDPAVAARACLQRPLAAVSSPRFLAKTALVQAFGENIMRPWRLLGASDRALRVLAYPVSAEHDPALLERCGVSVDYMPLSLPPTGASVRLSVELPAMTSNGRKGPNRPKRKSHMIKPPPLPDGRFDDRAHAAMLADYVLRHLSQPGRGLADIAVQDIQATYEAFAFRGERFRADTTIQIVVATVDATIADAGAFAAYLAAGAGRARAIGLGTTCLLETTTCAEAA